MPQHVVPNILLAYAQHASAELLSEIVSGTADLSPRERLLALDRHAILSAELAERYDHEDKTEHACKIFEGGLIRNVVESQDAKRLADRAYKDKQIARKLFSLILFPEGSMEINEGPASRNIDEIGLCASAISRRASKGS